MGSVTMTAVEYAAHRGCSDSYIRRMRREGKLVLATDGKRIDVASSDSLLDDITDPFRGGDRTPGAEAKPEQPTGTVVPFSGPSVQEAVRRERLARARLAELELGELSKSLTNTANVERAVFTLVRQLLNGMMGMPGRLRAKLAAESDPRAIEAMLDAEVRQLAQDMQQEAGKLQLATAAMQSAEASA